MRYRAVIFDLGGVVLGSPLDAIAGFERERGLPGGTVNRVVVSSGADGAWARLERGELSMERFYEEFAGDCAAAGAPIDARELMTRIGAAAAPRPRMVAAVGRVRAGGLRAGALTNNWVSGDGTAFGRELRAHFDVVVESAVVGLRKPDPRIYELACRALGCAPREAVFLDDIGGNLKPARALGMTTIKVGDPDVALAELATLLGLDLGAA
jgi:putative hydrolase of the HAD superfamily